ncbi:MULTISPECIES: daptide-type RiPP biosynthesis aminotransferase [unclassified Microbacterium]|uniref:daptide-type RiPP biosynthesis aminotransferase n=1 Tax=unclassified Microbacterium TaxID=2609290 RepID=UPI0031396352
MTVVWPAMMPADARHSAKRIAVGARGHRLAYEDGSSALCATSGLWNVPLGYGNATVADAVARALHDASYLTLFRSVHRPAERAAEALIGLAGQADYRRVIFSTSGGAANDAVMKLARQYWAQRGRPERTLVVGLLGSYHGTMYGSHSLSGDTLLQPLYALDRRAIRHVSLDDLDELTTLLRREGDRVAAVVVEPVLGSGAHPLPEATVRVLVELRERYGFLLVADEVATGFARTGPMFASGTWPERPDLLVLSKALTNAAMGAAAVLVGPRVSDAFATGGWTFVHGETQAGTPACAAAILAVVDELARIGAEATVRRLGENLRRMAGDLVRDGVASGVRGRGCFLAVTVPGRTSPVPATGEVSAMVAAIAEAGAIVHPGTDGIQLVPAYDYAGSELSELGVAIRTGLTRWREGES